MLGHYLQPQKPQLSEELPIRRANLPGPSFLRQRIECDEAVLGYNHLSRVISSY